MALFRVCICFIISGFMLFGIAACNRPNPTPELADPIYSDLLQHSSVAKNGAESKKAEIKQLTLELNELPARDIGRKKLQDDITSKQHLMMAAEQEALYYEIRAGQRKTYARTEYLKAFDRGEVWPDPRDFELYKAQKRLKAAPRDWGSRVPKTNRYNRASADDVRKAFDEKEKAPAGGKAH